MSIDTPLSLFGLATTPLELVSFLLSIITVWLNIRQNHWAWLFSILSSLMYAAVFVDARIYGDAGLQFVFVAVSVWGWYQWLRGGVGHRPLAVSHLDRRGWAFMFVAWGAGFLLLSSFLKTYTDTDVPHADAFLTAGSLVGQFLLSRKKVENWLVWIAVDVLYVGLYVYKHLMLTGALYALFIIMAYAGWRGWLKAEKLSREQIPA